MTTPQQDITMPDGSPLKVMLILERSEDPSVGVGLVRDMEGRLTDKVSSDMPAVGTWSTFGESGLIYVSLLSPIDALHDFLIQYIRRQSDEIRARSYHAEDFSHIEMKPTRTTKIVRPVRKIKDVSAWNTEEEDTHIFTERYDTQMHGRIQRKEASIPIVEEPVAEPIITKSALDDMRARLGRR